MSVKMLAAKLIEKLAKLTEKQTEAGREAG